MFLMVTFLFLVILTLSQAEICPVYCQCWSETGGRCVVRVQSSVCLLNWGRLFVEINDWGLIDGDTFAMCRSLHYVSISGRIHYLDADLLRFPSKNITDMYIQNTLLRAVANGSLRHFSQVKNVFVTSNRLLTSLAENSFDNLHQMYLLDLSHNALVDISRAFVSPLDSLRILKLNHNKIESIHKDTFRNLRQLRILELQYNRIRVVEAFGFRGLEGLVSVRLSHNLLPGLHHLEVAEMSSLASLDLSHNRLERFLLPSCPGELRLVNLAYNNLSITPLVQRRRCLGLKKVLIHHNLIRECPSLDGRAQARSDLFDLAVCEKDGFLVLSPPGARCPSPRPSFIVVYVVMIVVALCILVASFFVPFCVYRHQRRSPTSTDLQDPKKEENKIKINSFWRWSTKRRSSITTDDDLFI